MILLCVRVLSKIKWSERLLESKKKKSIVVHVFICQIYLIRAFESESKEKENPIETGYLSHTFKKSHSLSAEK